jgi:hypothetical protein
VQDRLLVYFYLFMIYTYRSKLRNEMVSFSISVRTSAMREPKNIVMI